MTKHTKNGWVEDGDQDGAEEFSQFLEANCNWPLDAFGNQYPWPVGNDIPPREAWNDVLQDYHRKLASVWGDPATETKVHCGYVLDDATGKVYVQVPEQNMLGFQIRDDDQSWDVPPFKSWTAVADDDPRVSDDDRQRLGWILDEARG